MKSKSLSILIACVVVLAGSIFYQYAYIKNCEAKGGHMFDLFRCVYPQLPDKLQATNPLDQRLVPANSWGNYDEFAQDIVNATHDIIVEKRLDDEDHAVYTTQKGNLVIRKNNLDDYSVLADYSLDGAKISQYDADRFVDSFMKSINYQMDGTEKIDRTDYGSRYRVAIQQKNHGWIVQNQMMQFEFLQDSSTVYIRLGKWYNNLPQIELKKNQTEAKEIAFDYLISEKGKDPNLVEQYTIGESGWVQMEVVNDQLVYVVAGSGFPLRVLVDPVSGSVIGLSQPIWID